MTREQILSELLSRVGNGLWVMAALKSSGKPINKERIREVTNQYYRERNIDVKVMPIRSRHTLDEVTARLEGAGLVDVMGKGRAKMYSLSRLGQELIEYRKQVGGGGASGRN